LYQEKYKFFVINSEQIFGAEPCSEADDFIHLISGNIVSEINLDLKKENNYDIWKF